MQVATAPAWPVGPPHETNKETLRLARQALREQFERDGDSDRLLRQLRLLVDAQLKRAWRQFHIPESLALVAVGGYGRGELYPFSDVDILILLPGPLGEADSRLIEGLIGHLWDIGLEVGHSVRTVAECIDESAKDITVQTSLLEARRILGSRGLFEQLRARVREHFDAKAFFAAKQLEQEQRHLKYQESPFNLEPNVKEAPGGLRDLQVLIWIGRATGVGGTWTEFAGRGLITRAEARLCARHENTLTRVRIILHYAAGRREDRLLFDYQETMAEKLGFAATADRRASERVMEKYYRTAKSVTQLNTIIMQNLGAQLHPYADSEKHPVNERFQSVRDLLDARDPELFEREPRAILECFLLMQEHAELNGITAPTLRALWRARSRIDGRFRRDPGNRALFLRLFQSPRGIVHELRRMNQYSILGRYLPDFGRIVGQMQHDLFHVYTVDQHILMVVRNLRRFTMLEFAHEYPLCSRLMAGFERHWLLYIAALFHDIAKGRGGDHSELGSADALRFCRAHELPAEDTALITFLVENHLRMSAVAQKQDLSDPQVIARFAELVGTERRLTALYLLTVADVRGTSPKVWNAWKGKLLEDLYDATRRRLAGGMPTTSEDIQAKQAEARRLLRIYGLADGVEKELWQRLDVPYFLRHDAKEIAWQTRLLYNRIDSPQPVVKARLSPVGEGLQVMIYAHDQAYLFARICGYFESIGFSIVDAKIHTTRHSYALDTFQVLGTGALPHYREMIQLIETELARRIERQEALPPPVRGRVSRQLKHFPIQPEVHIKPDENGQYYALSVTTGDRPGLLYRVARVLGEHRLDLHSAKITTLGERAEDSFLISGDDLARPRMVLQLEQDLISALHE
jgi:[protein-PII] uridylyltransferase